MRILFTVITIALSCLVLEAQIKDRDFKTKLKEAKKQAKKFEKDGWYVAPGDIPLDKQFENNYMKRMAEDDDGFEKYMVATGNSVAGAQSAAKLQATELAKLELAGMLSSQIAATVENQVANNQLSTEEAATLQKTVASSKNVVSARMGRVITLVEMYRKVPNTKNLECAVTIGYSAEAARRMALGIMREDLQKESNISSDKLDKLFEY